MWRRGVPSLQRLTIFFSILVFKMAILGAFLVLLFTVQLIGFNAQSSAFRLRKLAVACMHGVKGIKTSLLKKSVFDNFHNGD